MTNEKWKAPWENCLTSFAVVPSWSAAARRWQQSADVASSPAAQGWVERSLGHLILWLRHPSWTRLPGVGKKIKEKTHNCWQHRRLNFQLFVVKCICSNTNTDLPFKVKTVKHFLQSYNFMFHHVRVPVSQVWHNHKHINKKQPIYWGHMCGWFFFAVWNLRNKKNKKRSPRDCRVL